MKINNKYTHILSVILVFMLMFTCIPIASGSIEANAATKVKKGTVYNQVIKKGNIVYCTYNENGNNTVLKVNLKTGKKTKVVKNVYNLRGMQIKGNYIYYGLGLEVPMFYLYRVNIKTGKKQKLANVYSLGNGHPAYVVGKNTIYYKDASWKEGTDIIKSRNMQMKLNGKSKKKLSNTIINIVCKNSNVSGYKVIYKGINYHYDNYIDEYTYDYYKCYLKQPNGKQIYLAKVNAYW